MGNFQSFVLYKNSRGKLYKYFDRNEYYWVYRNNKKSDFNCNVTISCIDDNEFKVINKNMNTIINTYSGYYSTPTLLLCNCNYCGIDRLENNTIMYSLYKETSEFNIPKKNYYKTYITETLYRKTNNDFLYTINNSPHIFRDDHPNKSLYKLNIELEGAKFDVIIFIYFHNLCKEL